MKLKSRSVSQSDKTWSARILPAAFVGLLSALLTVNLSARAETRSLTTTSAAQSPLKFSADLNLDRGCGSIYHFGDQVVVAYSVSHDDDWVPFASNTGQDKAVAVWNTGDCEFKVTWSDTNGRVEQKTVKPGKRTSFIGSKTLTKVIVHDCVGVSEGSCKWGAKIR